MLLNIRTAKVHILDNFSKLPYRKVSQNEQEFNYCKHQLSFTIKNKKSRSSCNEKREFLVIWKIIVIQLLSLLHRAWEYSYF